MAIGITPEPPVLDRTGIYVNDKRFEEWTDYDIAVDIFRPANTFGMRCGAIPLDVIQSILPGKDISIYFGDGSEDNEHIVLTGWSEGFDDETAKETWKTEIMGRDKASDLLESTVPQDLVLKNRTLYEIAQTVCDVVGLNVIVANDANRIAVQDKKKYKKAMSKYGQSMGTYNSDVAGLMSTFAPTGTITSAQEKQFSAILSTLGVKTPLKPPFIPGVFQNLAEIEPQDEESCWDFLARIAEKLEVLIWTSHNGMVVIQRPRYDQPPSYLFMNSISEPHLNNVVRRNYRLSIAGIPTSFTQIGRVKTDGKRERVEVTYDSTRIIPSAEAATVVGPSDVLQVASAFYRPRWSLANKSKNAEELARKAWYSLKTSEMGYLSIEVVVEGHDQGGILYTPDTVARLVDEKLGIDGNYYIASCEYEMGVKAAETEGKQTRITMTPLYAWSPQQ